MSSDVRNAGNTIAIRFLEQDQQRPEEVAGWLADFVDQTRRTLDIALYDCRLSDGPASILRESLQKRLAAGIQIRLIYDAGDKPQGPAGVDECGVEPVPHGTHERVAELGLPANGTRAIQGLHALMHHKYLIRDGESVWTGSLNLSDDSMRRMENIVVTLDSLKLASYYRRDYEQLWRTETIVESGDFKTDPDTLRYRNSPALADVDFSPGRGLAINALVAKRVAEAKRRVVICSMLFTSSRLVRALVDLLDRGEVEISGVFDGTQMAAVLEQWKGREDLRWKMEAVTRIVKEAGLVGKNSTPYRPEAVHDFLHIKAIVVDDTVLTGSHNFSHAAQANAENVVAITSAPLAEEVAAFAARLALRYRSSSNWPHS